MMRVLLLVIVCLTALSVSQGQTVPHISNDFFTAFQFAVTSSDASGGNTRNEAYDLIYFRDYEGNRVTIDYEYNFKRIFRYDRGWEWNISDAFHCKTLNITILYNNSFGSNFLPAYDYGANHLRDTTDEFRLIPNNYTFEKNESINGIMSMKFNGYFPLAGGVGGSCTNPVPLPPYFKFREANTTWWFSTDNVQFFNATYKNIPVSSYTNSREYDCVNGKYNFTGTRQETLTFIDFHPERPDWRVFEAPDNMYCAELSNRSIPVLPPAFQHVTEFASYPEKTVSYARFMYDYNANKLKIGGWRPGGYIDVLFLDVNNFQVYNMTFNPVTQEPPMCVLQTIPKNDNFSFISRFIDWTTNPPHLVRFTESFITDRDHRIAANWSYAGHKVERGVWNEIWFQEVLFSGVFRNQTFSIRSYDAWYFVSPDWNIRGINESQVAFAMKRQGMFFNASANQWVNFSTDMAFTDQQYGPIDPREFRVPFFCPGGVPDFNGEVTQGLSSTGAVGLSFGMIILGIIIGVVLVVFVFKKNGSSSSVSYEKHNEGSSLAPVSGYGSQSETNI